MPNQFGLDRFDLSDAFGKKKENLCSKDLKEFIRDNHLDLSQDGVFNPRLVFGSRSDADHVYNTPRAWYMGRYFNPKTYRWDGENADYTPESDDIPWSLVPEKKITVEDIKYILSSYYQGTRYDPYRKGNDPLKGLYRPIGVAKTDCMAILQIRGYMPEAFKGLEWICFASNAFNTVLPVYTHVTKMPKYLSEVTTQVSTDTFTWGSHLIAALADSHFGENIQHIERYQLIVPSKGYAIVKEYDEKGDPSLLEEANEKLAAMAKEETLKTLGHVLRTSEMEMKNNYARSDN